MLDNINNPSAEFSTDIIAREVGEELLARLDLMSIKPKVILLAGGEIDEQKLQKIYPEAQIITQVPPENQIVDMVIANMWLVAQQNHEQIFKEWHRVLRTEGLILFSTLGPDTLKAYKKPEYMDMHDIGDLLLACGFVDPVVDVSYITLSYRDPKKFCAELRMEIELPVAEIYDAPFEIVYGHAFVPAQRQEDGVTYVSVSHLRRQLMKS